MLLIPCLSTVNCALGDVLTCPAAVFLCLFCHAACEDYSEKKQHFFTIFCNHTKKMGPPNIYRSLSGLPYSPISHPNITGVCYRPVFHQYILGLAHHWQNFGQLWSKASVCQLRACCSCATHKDIVEWWHPDQREFAATVLGSELLCSLFTSYKLLKGSNWFFKFYFVFQISTWMFASRSMLCH